MYGFIVEYQKALLRYIRPGITPDQVMQEAAADMRSVFERIEFRKGFIATLQRARSHSKGTYPILWAWQCTTLDTIVIVR